MLDIFVLVDRGICTLGDKFIRIWQLLSIPSDLAEVSSHPLRRSLNLDRCRSRPTTGTNAAQPGASCSAIVRHDALGIAQLDWTPVM